MKLPIIRACHPAQIKGNFNRMTVMGETWMNKLSDAGSIPAWSTRSGSVELRFVRDIFTFAIKLAIRKEVSRSGWSLFTSERMEAESAILVLCGSF
jgi:hypothetical protein